MSPCRHFLSSLLNAGYRTEMNPMTISPTQAATGSLTGVRVIITHDKEQAKDQADLFTCTWRRSLLLSID